jgi:hypothetical protein
VQNSLAGSARGKWSLARSTDGGRIWHDLTPAFLRDEEVWAIATSVHRTGELLIGTSHARVFRSADAGRNFTECSAFFKLPGRDRWSLHVTPYVPRVRTIAYDPADPDTFYVGVEEGGVFRSSDGGASFQQLNHGLPSDIHCIAPDPAESTRLYAATGHGVYISGDGGSSWNRAKGLSRNYAVTLLAGGYDGASLYLAAAAGPPSEWSIGSRGADAMLFHSNDHGSSFVPYGPDGSASSTRAMLMRMAPGADGDDLVYAAFTDGSIVRINERQCSMQTIAEKLPPAYDLLALNS